jgi:hypothetical protein
MNKLKQIEIIFPYLYDVYVVSVIAQSLQVGRPGFDDWRRLEIFVQFTASRPAEVYPASYQMGTCNRFLEGKAARAWSYTSTPLSSSWRGA